ncbi:NAD(P)-binding protein [Ascodesmis nigricans]|uniref:NAD(P)-binding protein n=1 Tax=Ascodesmis nigricans TaxID=341454 RepID=A0A4S2MLP1_9PEZI|nr:NAD(P)-binding protein [Ascodesmis nigricans]
MPHSLSDRELYRYAPVLIGTTRFAPLPVTKNILITGGAGFIASWLVRHLTLQYADSYRIVSFDKLDYCASLNNTAILDQCPNFTFVQGDVTKQSDVSAVLKKYDIDTIIHFAAQSHVDLSFGNSLQFTATNVWGTHVLLECARIHGKIKRFLHVSTDEVYGEVKDDEARVESSILAPSNPYAASKAAAEMLVHSYWKSYKLPIIMVRGNNVYGPHQYPEKIIPKFTLLLTRSLPLPLHGTGHHSRHYLYASDATNAFDTLLHLGVPGEIYNIGSRDETTNTQLCVLLLREFSIDGTKEDVFCRWVRHTRDRVFNDRRYAVDSRKLEELGWRPEVGLGEGLRRTVEWYRRWGERWWGDVGGVLVAHPEVVGGKEGTGTVEVGVDDDGEVRLSVDGGLER